MKSIIEREATFENNSDVEVFCFVPSTTSNWTDWQIAECLGIVGLYVAIDECLFVCCLTVHQHYLGHKCQE